MPDCRVEPAAPSDPKFAHLAELLEINVMWAFGLAVGVWCLCWRKEYLDGRMKRWTATALAWELRWTGDAAKLIDSMLDSEILSKESDGTLVAKNFSKRQGPLIKKLLADRKVAEERARAEAQKHAPPAPSSDDVVRQIVDQMRMSKITGSPKQKREQIDAWRARGIKGGEIIEKVMNNPGLDIFDLKKLFTTSNGTVPHPAEDSVASIRRKFLSSEEAK